MLGDLIADRYRVEAELGRGGMGVVFRAHDTRLDRAVAVKMLPADAAQSEPLRQRLASEARIASALNHPGIATVYDFIEQDEAAFIIYEFVPGRTLRQHLESERFNFSQTIDAALQLTEALTAAHDSGIIHRDLKPENIMVTPYVSRRGWELADEYVDTGWCGAKASRPELNRLMHDAALRKFACGVVAGTRNF
jgi:serine/threonine protein kinase